MNLIFITMDGARKDRTLTAKNYSNLISDSLFFSTVVTYAPFTIGAMHAVLSGTYGTKTGVNSYWSNLNFKKNLYKTLPLYLKDNGFVTHADVINKLVASTLLFTSFGLREEGDPNLDLINPKELIGDDPVGIYNHAASLCREAWRSPGALERMATSTIGEAKARSVLNARIFDTTILSWDISRACNVPNLIDEEQATYVLRVAEALVPAVRSHSSERYKTAVSTADNASVLEKLIATTGRDPLWGSESS